MSKPIAFSNKEINSLVGNKPRHIMLDAALPTRPMSLYFRTLDNQEAYLVSGFYGPRYSVEIAEPGTETWKPFCDCATLDEVSLALRGQDPRAFRSKEVFEAKVTQLFETARDRATAAFLIEHVLGETDPTSSTGQKGRRWLNEMVAANMLGTQPGVKTDNARGKAPVDFFGLSAKAKEFAAKLEAQRQEREENRAAIAQAFLALVGSEGSVTVNDKGEFVLDIEAAEFLLGLAEGDVEATQEVNELATV